VPARIAFISTFAMLIWTAPAHARRASGSSGGHFQTRMFDGQKRAQKEASQWNIADWLAQKSQMEWWDHWLAMNRSASAFELNLGAAHNKYTLATTDADGVRTETGKDSQFYNLDFYVTIFNLYGEFERTSNSRESWGGGAGLRLFGTSSQTTSLLARYGWRKLTKLESQEVWENLWAEGELQLYIASFLGLEGRYRRIFPNKSSRGTTLEGARSTAGLFVEFLEFRVFADVYREPIELKDSNGDVTKEQREGYEAGIKIYF
jgi:hypothetical protein